jgi:hypothetical protein
MFDPSLAQRDIQDWRAVWEVTAVRLQEAEQRTGRTDIETETEFLRLVTEGRLAVGLGPLLATCRLAAVRFR